MGDQENLEGGAADLKDSEESEIFDLWVEPNQNQIELFEIIRNLER